MTSCHPCMSQYVDFLLLIIRTIVPGMTTQPHSVITRSSRFSRISSMAFLLSRLRDVVCAGVPLRAFVIGIAETFGTGETDVEFASDPHFITVGGDSPF